jgi:hypothetical protein
VHVQASRLKSAAPFLSLRLSTSGHQGDPPRTKVRCLKDCPAFAGRARRRTTLWFCGFSFRRFLLSPARNLVF